MFLFGLAMIFISARMKAKENKNNNILSDDELTNCIHNMVNKLEKDDKEEKEQ